MTGAADRSTGPAGQSQDQDREGERPLVSVVVPVYNTGAFLAECLDSIAAQTYTNLEVIIVDDGSTDNSGALADTYAQSDPRVLVIHQQNQGLSAARNAALDAMTGEFVSFVDSDDWIHPRFVEVLLTLLRGDGSADLAVSRFSSEPSDLSQPPLMSAQVLQPRDAMWKFVGPLGTVMTVTCAKLYSSRLFAQIRFPVGRLHEDEFTTYKCVFNCSGVVLADAVLYFYRRRTGSITGSGFDMKRRLDGLDAMMERAEFFSAMGLGNAAYRPVLDEQMVLYRGVVNSRDPRLTSRIRREMAVAVKELRGTRQPLHFRLLVELHLIAPRIAQLAYSLGMRVRDKRPRR